MCILSGFINIETAAHLWKECNSTGLTILHNVFAHKQQGDVIYGTHVCHRGLETPVKECCCSFLVEEQKDVTTNGPLTILS